MSELALITGATSGIGRVFSNALAALGYDLILVGRRQDRLDEFVAAHSKVEVRAVSVDLATDAGVDVVAELCANEPLTFLVNNAGVAHYMPLADLPATKAQEVMRVKIVAPTMLSRSMSLA